MNETTAHKPPQSLRSQSIFYAAYGSNLSVERMNVRCPSAEVIGTSKIVGYRLLFKKSLSGFYATIEHDANCFVPVLIYKISKLDEAMLDRYEGCPRHYYKKYFQLPIKTMKGGRLKGAKECVAYILHEDRSLGEPSMQYFQLIDDGYRLFGFDSELLDKALSDSIGRKTAEQYKRDYSALKELMRE